MKGYAIISLSKNRGIRKMRDINKKSEVIFIRLPNEMKRKMQDLANRSGMTVSKYIRGVLVEDIANNNEKIPTRPFFVIQQLEKELMLIHNNLGYSKRTAVYNSKGLKLSKEYLRGHE
tara:strand:- start:625 stop:978 length:354 start_codon:yes stop_codon:yes gene_type:complete